MGLVEVPPPSDLRHAAVHLEDRKLFLDFHHPYYLRRCRHRLQKSQLKQEMARTDLLNGRVQKQGSIQVRFDSESHSVWGGSTALSSTPASSALALAPGCCDLLVAKMAIAVPASVSATPAHSPEGRERLSQHSMCEACGHVRSPAPATAAR